MKQNQDNTFEVAFLGTNGSCAYNNGTRNRYGTNTLCVAVKAGETTLIFDAGSGICGFNELSDFQSRKTHLFFSHYHVDHMNGLLFWNALFNSEKEIEIYGMDNVHSVIKNIFHEPYQPVRVEDFRAELNFNSLKCGNKIIISNDVTVKCKSLIHPNGCLGYRVEFGGKSICYMTDIELAEYENLDEPAEFVKNTNLLIIDCAYQDGKSIKGFGHSTPSECARLAVSANIKQLALYHYGFRETDETIDTLVESAKKIFPNSIGSYDGLRITI